MSTALYYILCIVGGGAIGYAARASFGKRRPLPPATRRQIDRAARANRAVFTGTPPSRADFDDGETEDFEPPRAA